METNASTTGRKNGLVWFLYQGLRQMVQKQELCTVQFPIHEEGDIEIQNGKTICLTEIARFLH